MATDSIRVSAVIPASPDRIYDAWLSGPAHAAMTGGAANVEPQVGGRFSAWDGYISGETLELSPHQKIVQTWRTTEFPEGSPHSRLEVLLEPVSGGTQVVFVHSEIPEGDGAKYESGWQQFYIEPMKKYFGAANTESGAEVKAEDGATGKKARARKAAAKAPAKAAAKKAAKAPAKKAPAKAAAKAPAKKAAAKAAPAKAAAKAPAKAAKKAAPAPKAAPAAKAEAAAKAPAKAAKKAPAKKAPAKAAPAPKAAAPAPAKAAAKAPAKAAKKAPAKAAAKAPAKAAKKAAPAPAAAPVAPAKPAAPARGGKKKS